jgi:DNA polymerase elongation subunit (family B)
MFLKKIDNKPQILHLRIKTEIYEYVRVENISSFSKTHLTKCLYYKPIVNQEFFYAEKVFRPSSTTEELEIILIQNNIELYKQYSLKNEATSGEKVKDFDIIDLSDLKFENNLQSNLLSKIYIHIYIESPINEYKAPLSRISETINESLFPVPTALTTKFLKTQPIYSIDLRFEPSFEKEKEKKESKNFKFIGVNYNNTTIITKEQKEIEIIKDFIKLLETLDPDVIYIKNAEDLLYLKDRLIFHKLNMLLSRLNKLLNRRYDQIPPKYLPIFIDEKRNLMNHSGFVDIYYIGEQRDKVIPLEPRNTQLFGRILIEFKTLGNSLLTKEVDDELSLQHSLENFMNVIEKNRNILDILTTLCGMLSLNIYNYLNKSKIAHKTVYYMNKDNTSHQIIFNQNVNKTFNVTTNKKIPTLEIVKTLKSPLDQSNYSENIKALTTHFNENTLGCPPLPVMNETRYKDIAQVDFKSFFPSLLIYYNLSPENIISEPEIEDRGGDDEKERNKNKRYKHIISLNGEEYPIYISSKRLGVIPSTMMKLLTLRASAIEDKDQVRNQTLKLLSNSIAGVLSKIRYNLGAPLIHCLMIQKSKDHFNSLISWFAGVEYHAIHGQCDGMFIPLKPLYEDDGTVVKVFADTGSFENIIKDYISKEFSDTNNITTTLGNESFKLDISTTYYKDLYIINLKSYIATKLLSTKSLNEFSSLQITIKELTRKDLTIKGSGYVQYNILSELFYYLTKTFKTPKSDDHPFIEKVVFIFEENLKKYYILDQHCSNKKIQVFNLLDFKNVTYSSRSHKKESFSDQTLISRCVGMINAFWNLKEESKNTLVSKLTDIYYEFTKDYHEIESKLSEKKTNARLYSQII